MSEHGENELKILLILHDDEIRNSEEKANQLNLNLNIKQIIIDCNYDKSCVLKKIKQFIEEKEQIIAEENLLRAINEDQKNKPKIR
jgi:hypothetical protein